jgi:hypothetical protein
MKYCLDTNTLIYFFKGLGNVSKHLLATPPNEIAIPAVVIFELEVGIGKSSSPRKRIAQLQEIVSLVNIIAFGQLEAKSAGTEPGGLRKVVWSSKDGGLQLIPGRYLKSIFLLDMYASIMHIYAYENNIKHR